jgi:hypothetical protein
MMRDRTFVALGAWLALIAGLSIYASADRTLHNQHYEQSDHAAAQDDTGNAENEIATATWLLAAFTLALSVSTIGLWITTIQNSAAQSRDTKTALDIAEKNALAAKQSADALAAGSRPHILVTELKIIGIQPANQDNMCQLVCAGGRSRRPPTMTGSTRTLTS